MLCAVRSAAARRLEAERLNIDADAGGVGFSSLPRRTGRGEQELDVNVHYYPNPPGHVLLRLPLCDRPTDQHAVCQASALHSLSVQGW